MLRAYGNFDSCHNSDLHAVTKMGTSLVQPHERTDIPYILDLFGQGFRPPTEMPGALVGDFSDVSDYTSAMQKIQATNEAFMTLDPRVRENFGHNPQQLLTWIKKSQLDDETALKFINSSAKIGLPSLDKAVPGDTVTPPIPGE